MQVQWDQIVSYYLLYSLGGLVILLTLIHMLYRRRSSTAIIAWLLLMLVAPYVFVVLYFLFGVRKRIFIKEKPPLAIHDRQKDQAEAHPIDRLLCNNGLPASTNDNRLTLYTDSLKAYEALYEAIKEARYCIHISTYILKNDAVTKKLFELLIEKSRSGVEVCILTDTVGSIALYLWQLPIKRLENSGVKVQFFMPLFGLPFHHRFNLRYHRKIYLIDNETLFSGGMNLAKEYMGPVHTKEQWTDLLYRCEGSVVEHYVNIFEEDWAFTTQQEVQKPSHPYRTTEKGSSRLQIIPSGPDVNEDTLFEAILYGIHNASQRIWIVSAYFIPNEPVIQALTIARHRGVDVKIIIPRTSTHLIENLSRSSYVRELQESGIEILFYEGSMLHAKAILFDDDAVILGSANLDNRSLLLNYEVATVVYSKEDIQRVDEWVRGLLQNVSSRIEPAGKLRRVFDNLMRIFAMQL